MVCYCEYHYLVGSWLCGWPLHHFCHHKVSNLRYTMTVLLIGNLLGFIFCDFSDLVLQTGRRYWFYSKFSKGATLKTVYSPAWCLKESRYSSMLVFLPLHLSFILLGGSCFRLVQTNFHPRDYLIFLNHFDKFKDVGVWFSHCFLQVRMPTFNVCGPSKSK